MINSWRVLCLPRPHPREGPGGTRHTRDDLATLADGALIEIPREHIRIPGDDQNDGPH